MATEASVSRVTELVGTSTTGWEDAVKNAVQTASKTLGDLRVAEIRNLDVTIDDGKVTTFRVRIAVSFRPGGDGGTTNPPPTVALTLTATSISSSQINLAWNDTAATVSIERAHEDTPTAFTVIGTATGGTYSNTGIEHSTEFTYRIRQTNMAKAPYSNNAVAITWWYMPDYLPGPLAATHGYVDETNPGATPDGGFGFGPNGSFGRGSPAGADWASWSGGQLLSEGFDFPTDYFWRLYPLVSLMPAEIPPTGIIQFTISTTLTHVRKPGTPLEVTTESDTIRCSTVTLDGERLMAYVFTILPVIQDVYIYYAKKVPVLNESHVQVGTAYGQRRTRTVDYDRTTGAVISDVSGNAFAWKPVTDPSVIPVAPAWLFSHQGVAAGNP